MGIISTVSVIDLAVIQSFVESFVVHGRIFHNSVIGNSTAIVAPFCVHIHFGFLGRTSFGGNQHNTIGTTGTVNSVGCGVFQHTDAFDVLGIDRRHTAIKRSSVHNVQGSITGAHRADTANTDCSCVAGLTATGVNCLYTCNLAGQGIGNVRNLPCGNVFCFNYRRRSCKRLFGCSTESNDHYFVQFGHFLLHAHHHSVSGFGLYRFHSQKGKFQNGCFLRHTDGKITVSVGYGTPGAALNNYVRTNDRLLVFGINNPTGYRARLSIH